MSPGNRLKTLHAENRTYKETHHNINLHVVSLNVKSREINLISWTNNSDILGASRHQPKQFSQSFHS